MPGATTALLGFEGKVQHSEHIAERCKEAGLLMTSLTAALTFQVYERRNVLIANDL